ncbi:MAG: ABC transporter permease [Oscillospiraceae bacterium]|jgi:peptide/nickel transport system permease protein|nr:ABC transporter permease [Oscillospiraceae bacterium]
MKKLNRRTAAAIIAAAILAVILAIYIGGALLPAAAIDADFSQKGLPPSPGHIFGTDFLGRDMFVRTIKGLSLSLTVGAVASAISAVIALAVGLTAALGRGIVDHAVNWFIDVFMSVPHTVLIILISVALSRGAAGMLIGVAVTHWVSLARIIRGEVLQIRSAQYIAAARGFGKSRLWIARRHVLPHLLPQFFVGLILLFPHAIMHESGLTFLGFGLPPERPAIGIILAESMRYISSGAIWLAIFPGVSLVILVLLIDKLGSLVRYLLEPREAQM